MNIPNQSHYGSTPGNDRANIDGFGGSFTGQLGSLVGSYTRTSLSYMAENLPVLSSSFSSTSPLAARAADEEEQHADKVSIYSNGYYASEQEARRGNGVDELTSLLSVPAAAAAAAADGDLAKVLTTDTMMTLAAERSASAKKSTFAQSLFNSTNILIGIGILAMPLALKCAGWVIGVSVFVFCVAITNYTAKLLAKCLDQLPGSQTYGDIGAAAFGTRGRVGVSAFFITELIAASVAFVVFLRDEIDSLFSGKNPLLSLVIAFLILTPTLFVPMRHLSYGSLLGIVIALDILIVMIYDGVTKPTAPGSLIEPAETEIWPSDWTVVPLSFGLMMAGFGGHSVFPTIYRDMEKPSEYNRVVNWTYVATSFFYGSVAVLGYLMFGADTLKEISENLIRIPGNPRLLNLSMLTLLALSPVTKYGLALNPVNLTWQIALLGHPKVEAWSAESHWRAGFLKAVGTVTLSIIVALLAYLLPNFEKVMSLLGAFFAFMICAIFPILCYTKLFYQSLTRWQLIRNCLLIVVSLVMAITGTMKSFA